jgi:hypothetical protein
MLVFLINTSPNNPSFLTRNSKQLIINPVKMASSSKASSSQCCTLISKCTVFPDKKSTLGDLKLSVSDLPMLSVHYIQKGGLFTSPPIPIESLVALLKSGLSQALSHFPPLAGRLRTDSNGYVYITSNDEGVEFIHATATKLYICDILAPPDVPDCVKEFFALDRTVSYDGHFKPILVVQITELADGIFIGCTVNHAVTDGTSFWNFFNTFAEKSRGVKSISKQPDFTRSSRLISPVVLQLPKGGPKVSFSVNEPLRERIFSFSGEAIKKLKARTNKNKTVEISSFQSLSALLWRSVTRARKLPSTKMTTFRMAVNCRHRLEPKLDPYYFGNAIQSIPTLASAGDVLSRDLRWCAEQLNKNVKAHDNATVRRFVENWESDPKCFPLGNFDGASMTMGSSPRFPMYDNDFGWGRPLAVRSGRANKFDGKISAFPGREGGGSVDLEVVLAAETMAGLEADSEFMQYVSN